MFEVTTMNDADRLVWQASLGVPGVLRVTLSANDMLNLHATPKRIIPAPGAGKCINVIAAWLRYKFISAPYAGDFNSLKLQYSALNPDDPERVTLVQVDTPTDTHSVFSSGIIADDFTASTAAIENQGVYLSRDLTELESGDGIITIGALYTIESTT